MKQVRISYVVATGVVGALLALAGAVMAGAQTVAPPAPRPVLNPPAGATTTAGSFDNLAPGNRKIVRAIFEAQTSTSTVTGTGAGTTTTKTMTLDQIAAMKQGGRGWGEVYKDLQKQGLVTEKNLGQAVSSFERRHGGEGGGVTTAAGRGGDRDDHGSSQRGGGDGKGNSAFSDGRGASGFSDHGRSGFNGGGGIGGHGGGRGR